MKVISVVDKSGSAIDRMAQAMKPYVGLDYQVIAVHPKRPDPEQLEIFESEARLADVIDYQYYRTADMLRDRYPWLREIPSILTHHNPYAIKESDWNSYQVVIANNQTIYDKLKKITTSRVELIGNAVDPYYWQFNKDWKPSRSVLMVANRIESKKGILEVAKACKLIGVKMTLVGNISDMGYFNEVISVGNVEFAQNIPDEDLRELYYKSGLHICNSVDNFESGTNPILESIFCGTPVLTRLIGHVPEFKSAVYLFEGENSDVEDLSKRIEEVLADKNGLEKKRHQAWLEIKDRIPERRAYIYNKLYRELLGIAVTVIIPIADRPEITRANLDAIANQTHKNIEVIVIDDGLEPQDISEFAKLSHLAIRYIRLGGEGYHLAQARNLGIIEATSDILVFCDQRMIMQPDAVEHFIRNVKSETWLFGDKGVQKKEFVENFSCILKDDIVSLGMFNERIDRWGGMSQEIRGRANRQHYTLQYLPEAKATPMGKSANRWRKKLDIMQAKTTLWKMNLR